MHANMLTCIYLPNTFKWAWLILIYLQQASQSLSKIYMIGKLLHVDLQDTY